MKIISELYTKFESFSKKNKIIFLVVILSLIPVLNLLHPGLPPTHDGQNQVVRTYEFDKTLRDGNIFPLWAEDLNYTYGVPLFNYVYPLPNYTSSFLHIFGFSFIDIFKLNLIITSVIGGVGAYIYAKNRFGEWGGVLTCVFYTFAPYHLLDVYIRGSAGEAWALALFPLCLYFLDRIYQKADKYSIIFAGMLYALIIFSHNILAVMFVGFTLTYSVLLTLGSKNRRKTALGLTLAIITGLLLSSIFFLPALAEEKYVVGLKIFNVLENFPELYQLIIPSWGSGFSGQTSSTQMSFQIGLANLLVVFLTIVGLFKKKIQKRGIILFFLSWFILLVFMISSYSIFVWEKIVLMQYFQFPWRFLSLVILCCSVMAGGLTMLYRSRILYVILIIFAILSTISYAKAPYFYDRTDSYYMKQENFIYGTNSIANAFQTAWLPEQLNLPQKKIIIKSGAGKINLIRQNSTYKVYKLNLSEPSTIEFSTAYFPGWRAYLDEKEVPAMNSNGKINVYVKEGKHTLTLKLTDTPVRSAAKTISILTFIVVLVILFKSSMVQLFHDHRN